MVQNDQNRTKMWSKLLSGQHIRLKMDEILSKLVRNNDLAKNHVFEKYR